MAQGRERRSTRTVPGALALLATLTTAAWGQAEPSGGVSGGPEPSASSEPPAAGTPSALPTASAPVSPPGAAPSTAVPGPSSAPPLARASAPSWSEQYARARAKLVAGQFEAAARDFQQLAARAPGASERSLALELGQLAQGWHTQRLVLREGQADDAARASGERSIDELATLYVNATLFGLGTGVWVASQSGANSPAGVIAPMLAFGGLLPGAIALVDHRHPLRYGLPQALVSGMYIGLSEGIVWTGWNQASVNYEDEWSAKTNASVIWGSAAAGALAGGITATVTDVTPGQVSFVSSGALWGGLVAGLGVAALHADDHAQDDAALLSAAIGMNLGVVGTMIAARPVSPSIARVRFLDLGGLGGGVLAGGLYLAVADREVDGRALAGLTSLGVAGGLGLAWWLTGSLAKDHGRAPVAEAASARLWPSVYSLKGGGGLGVGGVF